MGILDFFSAAPEKPHWDEATKSWKFSEAEEKRRAEAEDDRITEEGDQFSRGHEL
jgi:hypothetical protein